MNMMAMLSAMGGANPSDLRAMVNIPCGPCIEYAGPDRAQATTLVGGTLVCDRHAGDVLQRLERDSDNLQALADAERLEQARGTLAELQAREVGE